MALTVTLDTPSHNVFGQQYKVSGRIAFDSTYVAGGEALTAANIGLRVIDSISFDGNGHLGYIYYTDTVLPATSINVEILCPTGGTAPTSVADPSQAATGAMTAGGADSTALTTHTHPAGALTGGRGVEMGTADASTLTAVRFTAFGV